MYDVARIVSPDVLPMTMGDVDLSLTRDMSMTSLRVEPFTMHKSASYPQDYSGLVLANRGKSGAEPVLN